MKWGIAILLLLGVVAAGSAALLINTLRVTGEQKVKETTYVEVAKARADMPAMTQITMKHIEKERVPKENMPEGKILSASQVIGKTLAVPVVEGQILTASNFIPDGAGAQLVSYLPEGMRAVSVTLSSRSTPDALLLYPGSIVDMLVSFRLPSSSIGSALSTTMFTGLQVIAVQGESIVKNQGVEEKAEATAKRSSGSVTVTFLVDTEQAEALQLAVDNGSVMLSVRNPLDKKEVDAEATVLSQGRMAGVASVLGPTVFSKVSQEKSLDLINNALNPKNEPNEPNQPADANEPNQPANQQIAKKPASLLTLLAQAFLNPASLGQNNQSSQNNAANDKNGSEGNGSYRDPQLLSDGNYNKDQLNQSRQNPKWGVTVIRGSQTTLHQLEIHQENP